MSYDKLFRFKDTNGGCILVELLQKNDPRLIEIEIPPEHNGKPVLKIGDDAFLTAEHIGVVCLPESVEIIGKCAFEGCRGLEKINFPKSLKKIGSKAFCYCADLRCQAALPKSLESVGSKAFAYCHRLVDVSFLNSDTEIGNNVFIGCTRLSARVHLAGLTHSCDITRPIDPAVFAHCRNFTQEKFTVDEEPLLRKDILLLAAENGSFNNASAEDMSALFAMIIKFNTGYALMDILPTLAETELLRKNGLVNDLIGLASTHNETEATAWLLEYKKRALGFDTENDYEL